MNALLAAVEAHFDDAEGDIRIVGAEWCDDRLELVLSITYHDQREAESWSVTCEDVLEESLCSEWAVGLDVSAHSPLLKPYLELDVPLMFSQNEMASETLFGIVSSTCDEVMGRPEYLARFINGRPHANGICSAPFGLLGRFPASVADAILAAPRARPIQVNALAGFMPTRWNGRERVSYPQPQVLTIGRSYVIAASFDACRR